MRKVTVFVLCFWLAASFFSLINFTSGAPIHPQFTEPLKNMTISEGSNVEFNCYIRHLGSFRVMWLKRDEHKETFVAINLLKITKNPRLSVTMLQTSDDVPLSTIYIRHIEMEDKGVYECAVNTNPMISRTGTLDIPPPPPEEIQEVIRTTEPKGELDHNELTTAADPKDNEIDDADPHGKRNINATFPDVMHNELHDESGNGISEPNCSEMKSYWEEARGNLKEMLKNVFTSLVNITCSFFTPS